MQAGDTLFETLQLSGLFMRALVICGTLLVAAAAYMGFINNRDEGRKPALVYKKSDMTEFIIESCPLLKRPFRTPFWARSRHIQSVLGYFLSRAKFTFTREYLQMKDGGEVALDWGVVDTDLSKACPVLIALPGLVGDARCTAFLCKHAARRGLRPVVFNKRGHGGAKLTTPKLQSFGDSSDLREVVMHLRHRFPVSKLVAVGVSAGSALLTSYLMEYGLSNAYITAAVDISPGYNAQILFNGKVHPWYEKIILFELKRLLKSHSSILSSVIDVDEVLKSRTLSAFEESVYSKIYKFKDLVEYWEHNEPLRNYKNLRTPLLCISALDDPVCPKEMITYDLFEEFADMVLVTTERGGHCGFVEAGSLEPWAEKLAVEYLTAVLQYMSEKNH